MSTLKNIAKLIANLNTITGISFVSTTYTNKENELATYLFNVGVDYKTAQAKDLEAILDAEYTENDKYTKEVFETAKAEMVKSLRISLGIDAEDITKADKEKHANRSKGQKNAYTVLDNGLKVHNETGAVYVFGMKVKKNVITEGDYKADTRRPKTIAKDDMRKGMKSTQYRQFEIENAEQFKLKGETVYFGE